MIAYCSRTGTKNILERLDARGWRLLTSPVQPMTTPPLRYACDNGAWSAFQASLKDPSKGPLLDVDRFARMLARLGAAADFVIVPDVVADAVKTRELTAAWLPRVLDAAPVALVAVQNGMTPREVRPLLGSRVGVFVGGDTRWKIATAPVWAALARDVGAVCHVGRVNSLLRIRRCAIAGVTSFDGNCPLFQPWKLRLLDAARRQADMFPGNVKGGDA